MATVFLAEDLKHQRPVAIKVLHSELAAALGSDRFLREIEIAARLRHPHILPLYDSGSAGRFLYYVMPYVEGESLRDRLEREKQFSLEDALKITAEVASALAYAHSHGDRKSTRLNSSHITTSYAVFCLKKKKHPSKASDRWASFGARGRPLDPRLLRPRRGPPALRIVVCPSSPLAVRRPN